MARRFFDTENSLWDWFGKIPEIFTLSVLWIVLSLPVITIIPASCALYDAVARNLRPGEKGVYRRFFRTFSKELVRGILMSLLWLAVAVLLYLGSNAISGFAEASAFAAVYSLVYQILSLLPLAAFIWTVTLESRFVYPFWQLHKNGFVFTVSYLPKTALILLLCVLAVVICWFIPILILLMPALLMLLLSIPIEQVFMQYMPE